MLSFQGLEALSIYEFVKSKMITFVNKRADG